MIELFGLSIVWWSVIATYVAGWVIGIWPLADRISFRGSRPDTEEYVMAAMASLIWPILLLFFGGVYASRVFWKVDTSERERVW